MYKKISIQSKPTITHILVDDKEVQGVTKYSIEQEVGMEIPAITLTCYGHDLDASAERADIKIHLVDGWIPVDKLLPDDDEDVLALVEEKNELHQEVLHRGYFEETDAMYEGTYWCSRRTINIEALGRCKVIGWQPLPGNGDYDDRSGKNN